MELWDAYDKDRNKLEGVTLIRGEPIPAGQYHLVCDVLVQHADGTILLMQRDPRKHFGGMWEATAGGSALQGEAPLETAIRELREETGIEAKTIRELGWQSSHDTHYCEFYCLTDCDKTSVRLQEGETVAFRWVTKAELLSMKEDALVTKRMQKCLTELFRT